MFAISGPVHLVVHLQVLREQDEGGGQVLGGGGQGQEVQGTGGQFSVMIQEKIDLYLFSFFCYFSYKLTFLIQKTLLQSSEK